jgi:hypothetical protein
MDSKSEYMDPGWNDDGLGMDKHTQKLKQTQVSVSPMKRTNMSLCVFMFQCLSGW